MIQLCHHSISSSSTTRCGNGGSDILSSSCCSCSTSLPSLVSLWIAEGEVTLGFEKMCRFVLAFKSHWSIAESGSNSFSTVPWSLTRKRLLNVPCCILVFSTVFSRFIAENDLSHVAVVGEIVIVSLTNTRTLFRSFWLRASRDAYTSLGFNALCVAKKFFNSCHSLTAPSFSSW